MNLITPQTLHDLGINKSEAEESALIAHFEETLHERVGVNIIDVLDDEQAKKLIELAEAGDEAKTQEWLQQTIPAYGQIVQNEYDILMGELADSADSL